MITPQDTAQYGQVLRVSVVRAILNCRISASADETSKPRAIVVPMRVAFRNPRRVTSMGPSLGSHDPCKECAVYGFKSYLSLLSSAVSAGRVVSGAASRGGVFTTVTVQSASATTCEDTLPR